MFKRGDLVKHKIGKDTWMVEEVKEEKSWPWSKPRTIVTVLHRIPNGSGLDYGNSGRYAPDELVPA
jgi:hypothetical protein